MNPNDPKKPEGEQAQPNVVQPEVPKEETPLDVARKTTAREAVEAVRTSLTLDEATEIWKQIPAVVLVDDDRPILRALPRIMGPYVSDRKIIVTFDGPEEVLDYLHLDQLVPYSLIICDNSMQSPMKGTDLAQEIQRIAADKHLTFILHSSDIGGDFQKRGLQMVRLMVSLRSPLHLARSLRRVP